MPLNRINHLPSDQFKGLFIAWWKALAIINTLHTVRCQSQGCRQRRSSAARLGQEGPQDLVPLSERQVF